MGRGKKKQKGSKRSENARKRSSKRNRKDTKLPIRAEQCSEVDFCDEEVDFDELAAQAAGCAGFDLRELERALAVESLNISGRAMTALDRAQSIMYDAFEARSSEQRVSLAASALAVSLDCADAYVIMAEESPSLDDAIRHYSAGVEAGRRALGAEFDELVGHFWHALPTRPYMRALHGLADCLWSAGRRDQAFERYLELLRLNPTDNQGVRFELVPKLIEMGRDTELRTIFDQYDDEAPSSLFSRALFEFRSEGEGPNADSLLRDAIDANRHVAKYLTGQRITPSESPGSYQLGSDEEACIYALNASGAWKSVPGAIAWLRKISGVGLSETNADLEPINLDELEELPQDPDEVWQVDVRRLPRDVLIAEDVPLWSTFVLSDTESDAIATELDESKPTGRMVWDTICTAMFDPIVGDPRRPGCIEFADHKLLRQLKNRLQLLGVEAIPIERDEELDERFAEIAKQLNAPADARPLAALPHEPDEYWQIDCRQMGIWLPDESGEYVRPWVVLVTSPLENTIVEHQLHTEQPSLDDIWNVLEQGMRRPASGTPRRPGSIHVRSADQRLTLERRLRPLGISCDSSNALDHWDSVYDGLARHMEGQRRLSSLCELPEVTKEQLGSLFDAAARFFRAAPWRRIAADAQFELHCDISPRRWDAIILGQNGMMLGLALYEEGIGLNESIGELEIEEAISRASTLSLTFGEQHELSPNDLDAAEQFGWPVAAPEAYPTIFRTRRGSGLVNVTADELNVLEAALRSIPEFVASDAASATSQIELCDRTVSVTLKRK